MQSVHGPVTTICYTFKNNVLTAHSATDDKERHGGATTREKETLALWVLQLYVFKLKLRMVPGRAFSVRLDWFFIFNCITIRAYIWTVLFYHRNHLAHAICTYVRPVRELQYSINCLSLSTYGMYAGSCINVNT